MSRFIDRGEPRADLKIIDDLLHGKYTYGELAKSPERIPTNILAERFKRLEAAGIVVGIPYQLHPVRHSYSLTPKGRALGDGERGTSREPSC